MWISDLSFTSYHANHLAVRSNQATGRALGACQPAQAQQDQFSLRFGKRDKQVTVNSLGETLEIPEQVYKRAIHGGIVLRNVQNGESNFFNAVNIGQGYLLSVAHGVQQDDETSSVTYRGKKLPGDAVQQDTVELVYLDRGKDLALFKRANTRGDVLKPVPLANRLPLILGDNIFIAGYHPALGGIHFFKTRVSSAVRPRPQTEGEQTPPSGNSFSVYLPQIASTAFDPRGFSGSPVLNQQGELIGLWAHGYPAANSSSESVSMNGKNDMIDLGTIREFLAEAENHILQKDRRLRLSC